MGGPGTACRRSPREHVARRRRRVHRGSGPENRSPDPSVTSPAEDRHLWVVAHRAATADCVDGRTLAASPWSSGPRVGRDILRLVLASERLKCRHHHVSDQPTRGDTGSGKNRSRRRLTRLRNEQVASTSTPCSRMTTSLMSFRPLHGLLRNLQRTSNELPFRTCCSTSEWATRKMPTSERSTSGTSTSSLPPTSRCCGSPMIRQDGLNDGL